MSSSELSSHLRVMPSQSRLISSSELARELGITRQTIARWVQRGVITPASVTARGQARFDMEQAKRELRVHTRREAGVRNALASQDRRDALVISPHAVVVLLVT